MRPLPLPGPRKDAILALTPHCRLAAEIGADHGITSAHLLQGGQCGRLIVADISAASLGKAQRLFALHGLSGSADFRVADGLDALDGPVDAIIIAGMGAATICRMLDRSRGKVGDAALILQPNPDPPSMRTWLAQNGYTIEAERLAIEGRRYYIILRARAGGRAYTPKELLLGPCLLRERPEGWQAYLAWRRGCLAAMRGEDTQQAIAWIEEEMEL